MWAIWHQALVVNSWKRKINKNIIIEHPSCDSTSLKTIIHKFQSCPRAKKAWELAFPFLFKLKMLVIEDQPRKPLSLKQCLFNCKLLNSLKRFSLLWALLCGIVLWSIWIKWNDLIFNLVKWQDAKLRKVMWDSLLNYGRMEWKHTLVMVQKYWRKKVSSSSSLTKLFCLH